MQIDPHKFAPVDPVGKFSDDCVVMFDDGVYDEPQVEPEEVKAPVEEVKEEVKFEISAFEEDQDKFEMIDAGGDVPPSQIEIRGGMRGTQQYFDVYLTRVDLGRFHPGGDFIFYRMQLVMDRSRDIPILLTRWGRIGE